MLTYDDVCTYTVRAVKRTGLGGGPARRVNPADGAAALDELEEEVLYKPLSSLYSGSIKPLSSLYQASIQALLRRYCASLYAGPSAY